MVAAPATRSSCVSRGPASAMPLTASVKPTISSRRQAWWWTWPVCAVVPLLMMGCASAPLDRAGTLQSYDNLTESNGLLTRSRLRIDEPAVLKARTVQLVPTEFSAGTSRVPLTVEQRRLVANAVDRSLCAGLSERFVVVGPSQPADLTIRAVVTHVTPTDPLAAGASRGVSIAKMIFLPAVPVPVPRIPIGLGTLSLEAEARDLAGSQRAAMVWARGAHMVGGGRVAAEGDAYGLASDFGADFSKLLVTGSSPFGKLPSMPSFHGVRTSLGGAPSSQACEAFGRSPGLVGFMGGQVGLPPSWTDRGAAAPQ
jgi:hypothetical protein